MMKITFNSGILLLYVFATIPLFSQSTTDSLGRPFMLNVSKLRQGIYKSFDEFKYNEPSLHGKPLFDGKQLFLTNENGGSRVVKDGDAWGFCDGSKIYVFRTRYNELLERGRYCYFIEQGTRAFPFLSVVPPFFIPFPTRYKREIIVSFNSGKTYVLTKKVMKTILKTDDQKLLEEFLKQKRKQKKLFEFIVRYNQRNADKIK